MSCYFRAFLNLFLLQGYARKALAEDAQGLIEEWGQLSIKRGASLKDTLWLCQLLRA
jgi:hypothetical protein